MSPVDYGLAQPECEVDYSVLFLFASDRVVVHGSGYAGEHRIVISFMPGAADALDDHSHFFFTEQVTGSLYVCPAAAEIYRCVDTLYGLSQKSEHLVLVVCKGNHVCGVDSCKRLVVAVFQLGTGPYRQR